MGQDKDTIVAAPGHHHDTTVTPFCLAKGHDGDSIGTSSEKDRVGTPSATEIALPKQQLKIYDWFLKRGLKGVFNKPLIQRETGIAYTTIRKTLRRFEKLRILSLRYDESLKFYEYRINDRIHIKRVRIETGSGQGRDRVGTG